MNKANVPALKQVLNERIFTQHGGFRGEVLTKEIFLKSLWQHIASLVQYNRENSLVQTAVLDYPELIPRMYVLLSLLYGSYSYQPDIVSILKDLVKHLDQDLEEEELRICEYARGVGKDGFYPELSLTWTMIRRVYGAKEFGLDFLPPTPYHAYALLTLNRPQVIGSTDHATYFAAMADLHQSMQNVVSLTQPKYGAKPE